MTVKDSDGRNGFVVLSGVSKRYGSLLALDGVSFEVEEGEIFGYIGPNGAGKTTTMKILVGLVSDFQGEVTVGGYRMPERRDEIHRQLGYRAREGMLSYTAVPDLAKLGFEIMAFTFANWRHDSTQSRNRTGSRHISRSIQTSYSSPQAAA